jgi:hypothetical protein
MFGWIRKSWDWMARRSERVARKDAITRRQESINKGEWTFFGIGTAKGNKGKIEDGTGKLEALTRKGEITFKIEEAITKKKEALTKRAEAVSAKSNLITSSIWQKCTAIWQKFKQSAIIKKENSIITQQTILIERYTFFLKKQNEHAELMTEIQDEGYQNRKKLKLTDLSDIEENLTKEKDELKQYKNQLDTINIYTSILHALNPEVKQECTDKIEGCQQALESIQNKRAKIDYYEQRIEVSEVSDQKLFKPSLSKVNQMIFFMQEYPSHSENGFHIDYSGVNKIENLNSYQEALIKYSDLSSESLKKKKVQVRPLY